MPGGRHAFQEYELFSLGGCRRSQTLTPKPGDRRRRARVGVAGRRLAGDLGLPGDRHAFQQ
ncbi:MAG: hypothetical protein BGO98_16400 [Myxococcales bacterium 68-20]|nr:MAG: hypothetical protein BGO98_16400 [Myxococcales bacterium 68-20]